MERRIGRTSGETARRSVVLGGGGVPGTAWMTGLAAELRRRGIDLGSAESIVGASAGAVVGATLVTGRDLDLFADGPNPPGIPDSSPTLKPALLEAAFGALFDQTLDRDAARHTFGQLAMAEEPAQIAPLEWLVGNSWPDDRLRIAVVDAESGRRQIWDSNCGVGLATAVAASRGFPGLQPPVAINDRYYIDGGIWSGTNADIAAGSDLLLVLEPLAHQFPRTQLRAELATANAGTVVHFSPDAATIDVFNSFATNPDILAGRPSAFRAGVRQTADTLTQQLTNSGWVSRQR